MSISSSTWINGLAFSFDSTILSYVSHDCEINFVDVTECAGGKSKPKSEKVLHTGNPHMNCQFLNKNTLVACGFDKVPYVYKNDGKEWSQTAVLDEGINKTRATNITGNKFKDTKAHFNNDIKLDNSVMMKETDTKH